MSKPQRLRHGADLGTRPKPASLIGNATHQAPSASAAVAPQKAALRLGNWRCSQNSSFRKIQGQVQNMTGKPLANIMAVGVFATAAIDLVKSGSALLEYNPVMPGQWSPFTVLTMDNPMISRCSISFKEMLGGEVRAEQ